MNDYKLQLIPVRHGTNPNEIIGLQLPASMLLQQRTNEAWMDGKLQVDVIEINDINGPNALLRSAPPADPEDTKGARPQ